MSQAGVITDAPGPGTDVESITGDGGNPVTPDAAGNINLDGDTVANGTHVKPVYIDDTVANTLTVDVQVAAAVTGAPGDTNNAGLISLNDTQFTVDVDGYVSFVGGTDLPAVQTLTGDTGGAIGPDANGNITIDGGSDIDVVGTTNTQTLTFADRTRLKPGYVENLAFDYAVGTGLFSITAANGLDLSATNPGFVTVPHPTDTNTMVLFKITANQTFTDGNGSSDIAGNLFGLVSADDWTGFPLPFFVYAVTNDDVDNVVFMICRAPNKTASTVTASRIGYPGQPQGDFQASFFSFDVIDTNDYNNNPCTFVGSFRMEKDASNDWFVQTLSTLADGVGKYNDETTFFFPLGVNGASAGTYMKPNGGTAPVFTTNNFTWRLYRNGMLEALIDFQGDGGTDGAGAVTALIAVPYIIDDDSSGASYPMNGGRVDGSGIVDQAAQFAGLDNTTSVFMHEDVTPALLQNLDFGAGGRFIITRLMYWIEEDA